MTNAELEHRIERLERKLAASRWRMLGAAGVAAAIVGLACKPALPDTIKLGELELDSSGVRIGDVRLTKHGLAIGDSQFTQNEIHMAQGESLLFVKIDDRPQLTVKRKGYSVDLVAGDDFASVTTMSNAGDMQTLSTRNAAKAP